MMFITQKIRIALYAFILIFSLASHQTYAGRIIIAAGGSYAGDMRSSVSYPGYKKEPNKEFKGVLQHVEDQEDLERFCPAPQDVLKMVTLASKSDSIFTQLKTQWEELQASQKGVLSQIN